jgi:hypothetical protein
MLTADRGLALSCKYSRILELKEQKQLLVALSLTDYTGLGTGTGNGPKTEEEYGGDKYGFYFILTHKST